MLRLVIHTCELQKHYSRYLVSPNIIDTSTFATKLRIMLVANFWWRAFLIFWGQKQKVASMEESMLLQKLKLSKYISSCKTLQKLYLKRKPDVWTSWSQPPPASPPSLSLQSRREQTPWVCNIWTLLLVNAVNRDFSIGFNQSLNKKKRFTLFYLFSVQ